jgi:Methyltransferase small domain
MTQTTTFLVDNQDVPIIKNALSYLVDIDYCEKSVIERLGLADLTELSWRATPIYRAEQLANRDNLSIAIDLFLLQGKILRSELNQLFDVITQKTLIQTGLLLVVNEGCVAGVSLFPVGNNLIFSDHAWPKLPHPGYIDIPYNQVMYIGTDSRWLARTVSRKPVDSTLDLCTGSGIHAILAAFHSRRVVAVDINPRASHCTILNAQMSGTDNVEVKTGDLFEPVRGEKFDLITANPPFVPSPENSLGFRDGGRSGEDVLKRIISGLPSHLTAGGRAQIVTEYGDCEDGTFVDRLRSWLNGAPMDILILNLHQDSAASYATGHASGDDSFDEYLKSVNNWAGNLRTQGFTKIISAIIVIEWSNLILGQPWTRIEDAGQPHDNCADEIEEILLALRLSRSSDLVSILEHARIKLSGSIGLVEAMVIGSDVHPKAQVQLLEKRLPILRWIDDIERHMLMVLKKPMKLSEILIVTRELAIYDEASVIAALCTLIRYGLITKEDS